MPLIVTMPLTRMTAAELDRMALINAEPLVTVIGAALPPPVVPAPYPVGVPTAAAWPGAQIASAAAAATVNAPARPRRAIDVPMGISILQGDLLRSIRR